MKVANKCLNVRQQVEVVEWNKNGPLTSSVVLCVVSVSVKENSDRKKIS